MDPGPFWRSLNRNASFNVHQQLPGRRRMASDSENGQSENYASQEEFSSRNQRGRRRDCCLSSSGSTVSGLHRSSSLRNKASKSKPSSLPPKESHPSSAFLLKTAKEEEKLRQGVKRQLQEELIKLLEDELFTDVIIECDSFAKRCHSSILINRVPSLYKELYDNFRVISASSLELNLHIPFQLDRTDFLFFLRKVYSEDEIRKDEIDLVRRLRTWIMENSSQDMSNVLNETTNQQQQQQQHHRSRRRRLTTEESLENVSDNADTFNVSDDDDDDDEVDGDLIGDDEDGADDEDQPRGATEGFLRDQSGRKSNDGLNIVDGSKSGNNLSSSVMNSDSLTNVSFSDEKGLDEEDSRESNSAIISEDNSSIGGGDNDDVNEDDDDEVVGGDNPNYYDDYEDDDDDDDGDEDETGQGRDAYCSSSSSQMVRSGTFDLLCQMPLEDALDKKDSGVDSSGQNEETGPPDESPPEKPKTLDIKAQGDRKEIKVSNLAGKEQPIKPSSKVSNTDEDSSQASNDLDAETPVAEPRNSFPPASPGSMFQYFIDVDSVPVTQSTEAQSVKNTRTGSAFMFIDIGNDSAGKSAIKRIQGDAIRGLRSNSASIIDIEPARRVKSNTLTRNIPNGGHRSCQDLVENVQRHGHQHHRNVPTSAASRQMQAMTSSMTSGTTDEEIPLLPMSPILRRKRGQAPQPPTVSTECKARSSLDLKHLENSRMHQSLDSSDLMSCSWRSDGGKSDFSNSPTKKLTVARQYTCSPSLRDDDESVYSEVSSISSSAFGKDKTGSNSGQKQRTNAATSSAGDLEDSDSLLHRTLESCSKLGEDLLRMFFSEINADVVIQAEDKEIKAHKCILVSRSRYFMAMLTGEWMESTSQKINLKGFSYNSVHFALCHMYSGAVVIPRDSLNLGELALLSDLLSLDTLKEVVLFELRKNYCHFFHKPCPECINGVLDCLVLSSQCGLDSLHQRCLQWIGKYFLQIWPNKAFASLQPSSLIQACYQSTINQLSPDNIIEVILNCERLASTVPRIKWAEVIFSLIAKLMEDCCNYVASNYDLIVATSSFVSLGKGRSWNISTLEGTLLAAMNALTPDVACKTMIQLGNILVISDTETAFGYGPYCDSYVALVKKMYRHCERYLIHNAGPVAHCQSWNLLSRDLQEHIKNSAVIVFEFDKPLAPKPKLSSVNRKPVARTRTKSSTESGQSSGAESKLRPTDSLNRNLVRKGTKVLSKVKSQASSHVANTTSSSTSSSGTNKAKTPTTMTSSFHIYDEVPAESSDNNSTRETRSSRNHSHSNSHSSHHHSHTNYSHRRQEDPNRNVQGSGSGTKKSQVAKVSPFTVKQTSSHSSNNNVKDGIITPTSSCARHSPVQSQCSKSMDGSEILQDLVAQIDADSNLVNNYLQEAELLEQELKRKLEKQNTSANRLSHRPSRSIRSHARTNSADMNSSGNSGRMGSSHTGRPRPASGTGRPQGRPPFK